MELFRFFFIKSSILLKLYINFLIFFGFHWFNCCFVISLSFQKIGGFAEEIVNSIFLFFSSSFESCSIFFDLFKKDLAIKIQSSLLKLFSFKILIIFFLFFAKQLSTNSATLWFSLKLVSFIIFSLLILLPFLL